MGQEASVIAIFAVQSIFERWHKIIENEPYSMIFLQLSLCIFQSDGKLFFHNEVTFILATSYHCMKNEDSFITLEYHTVFMTFFSCCFYSLPFFFDNL